MDSIPIARSINPDDSVDLTRLRYLNLADPSRVNWTLMFRRKNRPDGRTYKPDWPVFRAFGSCAQSGRATENNRPVFNVPAETI